MKFSSKILEETVDALSTLPGIGKKSALRLALHLERDDSEKALKIINSLGELKKNIKRCSNCFNLSDYEICRICEDKSRKKGLICIVESVRDVMAIEETSQFNGLYHVLGGIISPLEGIGPEDLSIDKLMKRIENETIEELVMAISPSIEGETTIYYLSKLLDKSNIKISVIARGVSFGGDLEYADEITLGRSIVSRLPYKFIN